MDKVTVWFKSLQPRERLIVTVAGGVIAIAALYLLLFGPFAKALSQREQRVTTKQQDLAWMRGVANNVRTAALSHPASSGGESLVVLVNRTAQQAGLKESLANQAPQGENSIRIQLIGANFDSLVTWLGTLEQQWNVRLENATVDRADKSGIVNASITLSRGGQP